MKFFDFLAQTVHIIIAINNHCYLKEYLLYSVLVTAFSK